MWNNYTRVIIALLAAAAAPTVCVLLLGLIDEYKHSYYGTNIGGALQFNLLIVFLTFSVALVYAVVGGLPAYFLARKLHLVNWWASIIGGFIIGAAPAAIFAWPIHNNKATDAWNRNHKEIIDYVINGTPTMAGWLHYVNIFCGMGLLGMLGGFTAWLVWQHLPSSRHTRAN